MADLEREFTGWRCWRGASGRCYARKPGQLPDAPADAEGEDPRDLRDDMIRACDRDG